MRGARGARRAALLASAGLLVAGCRAPPVQVVPLPAPPQVEQLVTQVPPQHASRAPGAAGEWWAAVPGGGRPVNLSATGVDIRLLLPALAEAAGVSLLLGPEVRGRVSVHFDNVPALEALRLVLEQAGLAVLEPPVAPWAPVVFYQAPVHIDHASAATIRARFGVDPETARWIVEARR
jgi:hypothetical protein